MTATSTRNQWGFPMRPFREEDYGFFGPDSIVWKVFTEPAELIALLAATGLEHFDPALTAAVADMDGIYTDPLGRADNTLAYFMTVVLADSHFVLESSRALMRVHAQATGNDPVTGKRYNANDPGSQLWIQITGWYMIQRAYEVYGPGPLTEAQDREYWAACRIAAQMQTCRPEDIPESKAGAEAYIESMRPQLSVSERAKRGMKHLVVSAETDAKVHWLFRPTQSLLGPAALALWPEWMRETAGLELSPVDRVLVKVTVKPVMTALRHNHALMQVFATRLVPKAARILEQQRKNATPRRPVVVTVEEARAQMAAGKSEAS